MRIAVALLLLFLFAVYASQITAGMDALGTDWAMYVMHARNLVTGHPYAETGYIVQPEVVLHGAATYPSGYPLLLAPFYAVFGFNMRVFKLLNDVLLILSLWPVFLFARRTLAPVASLLLIVAAGCSLSYMGLEDMIGSDAPYQLWSFLVLVLILQIYDRGWNQTAPWKWGAVSGLLIAGAYLIRPIGVALLIAVAAMEIVRRRRPTAFLGAALASFVPLVLLNNLLFHKDAGYSSQFVLSPLSMVSHLLTYLKYLSDVFASDASHWFRYVLWLPSLLLALAGVVNRVRRGVTVAEWYFLAVLGILMAYWMPNSRYLLPVMPIYMVYILEGFEALRARLAPRFVVPVTAAAIALWLFAPAANLALTRSDPNDTLITLPLYEQMCQAVEENTGPRELLIFWSPRVLALSTGRHASTYPATTPERLAAYLQRVRPGYIVIDKNWPDDQQYLAPALAAVPFRLNAIFQNGRFRVLRVETSQ